MSRKKNIKIGVGIVVIIVLAFAINIFITIDKVGDYKVSKPYDELTFTEKIASKLGGYEFDTKKELEDKGLVYTEEKKEVKAIIEIFKDIPDLVSTKDSENIDEKIKKCETVLTNLHEENSSGKIKGDNLIKLVDDCINMTQHYKFTLESYKKVDVDGYKTYGDKVVDDFNKINSDMDRLGFKEK